MIRENDRSHGLRNNLTREREMQTALGATQCATAKESRTVAQTRMTVTVSLSEFRCGNACDTAMPAWTWCGVARRSIDGVDRCQNRSKRFLNLERAGHE